MKPGPFIARGLAAAALFLFFIAGPCPAAVDPEPSSPEAGVRQDPSAERDLSGKSGFTLFNPTPREKMRDFETDRPDKTESPYTLDAGHFAIETSIVSYTHNPSDSSRPVHQVVVAENNFKAGLFNNVDLQFNVQSFVWQRVRSGPASYREESGIGDSEMRLKVNLWGNDGGATAMGIMPYIGLPTNGVEPGKDDVTGGVIFPLQVKAPLGWKIGMMTQFDTRRDDSGSGYHMEWINTVAFHHSLFVEELDGYIEYFNNNSFDRNSPWTATVDLGLIYELSENFFVDCGVNVGATSKADEANPFVGLSRRF